MTKYRYDAVEQLQKIGVSYEDATLLRRISMTLHRWHELECGDDNGFASYCVVRGYTDSGHSFVYEDDGAPYIESHSRTGKTRWSRIPDRERGAMKRLGDHSQAYRSAPSAVKPL